MSDLDLRGWLAVSAVGAVGLVAGYALLAVLARRLPPGLCGTWSSSSRPA